MNAEQINRATGRVLVVLSLVAFLTVMTGYLPNHTPQADEGTAAHIFQLTVVAAGLTIVAFLATADWTAPLRNVRRLTVPAVVLLFAFAALFYMEHYYYPAHYPDFYR